jgi:hypothetical protein
LTSEALILKVLANVLQQTGTQAFNYDHGEPPVLIPEVTLKAFILILSMASQL